jgi:hypothetical protein
MKQEAEMLEPGYRTVPLQEGNKSSPLRIALIVKDSSEPMGGAFVVLRETADASVYLGAIVDAGGRIHSWLEIWAQNVDRFASSFPAYRDTATNRFLDERWEQRAEALRAIEPGSVITTGWETAPAPPIFYDRNLRGPVQPKDQATGAAWDLCRDEGTLAAKGLPGYTTSLARYLWIEPEAGDRHAIPVTSAAPENDSTRTLAEAFEGLLPFHPGGRLMVRTFAPIAYEGWVDLLSGAPWRGIEHGRDAVRLGGVYRTLQDRNTLEHGSGHLFFSARGLAARLAEAFHLKLHTLAAIFRLVHLHVQADRLPFLNLSAASFRLQLAESDAALPFLWNFKASLATPGEAVALPVATTSARYFVPAKFGGNSIYRPTTLTAPVDGAGQVRIRKVLAVKDTETMLEGTLATQERLVAGGNDLLWLRLSLPSGRVDLYAAIEPADGAASGEARFRTLPQNLPPGVITALRQAEGVPLPETPFQTVPLLSTPCDLYALGVLAVRTLLVDDELSLPVALDEILSLAGKSAAAHDPSQSPAERISALADGHESITATLGPHRLLREKIAPETAIFPSDLWWDAISLIIRLFPGIGPDSLCRDFGDAPPLALESVFSEPLAELEKLLVRSRSLLLVDWNYNREIRSVIGKFLDRASKSPASAGRA